MQTYLYQHYFRLSMSGQSFFRCHTPCQCEAWVAICSDNEILKLFELRVLKKNLVSGASICRNIDQYNAKLLTHQSLLLMYTMLIEANIENTIKLSYNHLKVEVFHREELQAGFTFFNHHSNTLYTPLSQYSGS